MALKIKTAIPYFLLWSGGIVFFLFFHLKISFFLNTTHDLYLSLNRHRGEEIKKVRIYFPERIKYWVLKKNPVQDFSRYYYWLELSWLFFFHFLILIAWWRSYSFKKSILTIERTVEKFLRGDFSVRFRVNKSDPLYFILISFNYMIDKLSKQIEEIEEKNRRLKVVNQEKSRLLEEIKKFNEELNRKVKEAVKKYQLINQELEDKIIELKNMKILNENIFSSLPGGLLTVNREGKIIFYNHEVEKIFSLSESKVGEIIYDVFPQEFSQFFRRMLEDNIQVMRDICVEIPENKFIGMNLSLLKNYKGEVEGCVAIFNDITQNIILRDQVNRTKVLSSLGQVAAGVAHEIRNPLGAIKGFVELIEEDLLGTRNEKYIKKILAEIDGIENIVSSILNYSRIKSPSFEDNVEINKILQEVVEIVKLKEKKFTITIEGMEKKIYHRCDSLQLKQVFLNILNNAIEAVEDEKGKIKIEISETEDYILLVFSDNGVGIAQEEIEKVFIPFYTTKTFGTGLGLAIVNRIVENHNGFIKISSAVGEGTTIKLYFRKKVWL